MSVKMDLPEWLSDWRFTVYNSGSASFKHPNFELSAPGAHTGAFKDKGALKDYWHTLDPTLQRDIVNASLIITGAPKTTRQESKKLTQHGQIEVWSDNTLLWRTGDGLT